MRDKHLRYLIGSRQFEPKECDNNQKQNAGEDGYQKGGAQIKEVRPFKHQILPWMIGEGDLHKEDCLKQYNASKGILQPMKKEMYEETRNTIIRYG